MYERSNEEPNSAIPPDVARQRGKTTHIDPSLEGPAVYIDYGTCAVDGLRAAGFLGEVISLPSPSIVQTKLLMLTKIAPLTHTSLQCYSRADWETSVLTIPKKVCLATHDL